ncbi:stress-responsive transcription factor hsf1 [Podila humilis]|nr:stress-responsive transcription factor hsf1 [Podila humilis]
MAPSSTNSNTGSSANTIMSPATRAAMNMIDSAGSGTPSTVQTSDAAMALLHAASNTSKQDAIVTNNHIQGPSTALPSASNMLVSGSASKASSSASSSRDSSALQQRPRPSSTARSNVAAFLTKLYNMVGDEGSNNYIRWSDDGHSFLVIKHIEFAKEVLPKFFKHNNFSSFVRQLNMYGFHKIPHLQQGVLLPDAESEQWEFSNPHFQKNQPDLLCLVSRKKASNGNEDKDALTLDLNHILSEVTAIKKHQIAISSDLKNIERDHQSLWQESITARERHQRQQDTIDKILRFLASVFSGEKKRAIVPNSKKPRLTITEGEELADDEFRQELSQVSEDASHEEEITSLLGHKRKRGMDDIGLGGADTEDSSGINNSNIFNISEITPALALFANAEQPVKTRLASPSVNSIQSVHSASSTQASTPTTTKPSSPSLSNLGSAMFPEYLASLSNAGYDNVPSSSSPFGSNNLNIPTTLLPNAMSAVHQDMLRSISMANANASAAPTMPLPPSFAQTAAGANVTKSVEEIAREMEELQRNIEALKEHGLNVNDFNYDNSYMNMSDHYDSTFDSLTNLNDSNTTFSEPLPTMGQLIHADNQDELAFITPALGHQHISSGQATPTSTGHSPPSSFRNSVNVPTTSVTAPTLSLSSFSVPTTPAAMPPSTPSHSSLSVPTSSVPSPASTLSPNSTAPPTPGGSGGDSLVNRRMSTVGDEDMEELFEMD